MGECSMEQKISKYMHALKNCFMKWMYLDVFVCVFWVMR